MFGKNQSFLQRRFICKQNHFLKVKNLAEGTARNTNKDKAHFTTLAFSSLMEVLNQLIISKELNFISEDVYIKLREDIGKISNMLNALRKAQLKQ